MHISEGVLRPEIIIPAWAVTGVAVSVLLYKLKSDEISKVAAFSAIFFVASFIHFPLFGVTSVHLILSGLIGIMLGTNAFLAIFVGLFFQGLVFGFGGLSSLGVNTLIMGFPAIFMKFIAFKISPPKVGFFLAGFLAILISAFLLALTLFLNGEELKALAFAIFAMNIPLAVIEGFITLFAVSFILKIKPGVLK